MALSLESSQKLGPVGSLAALQIRALGLGVVRRCAVDGIAENEFTIVVHVCRIISPIDEKIVHTVAGLTANAEHVKLLEELRFLRPAGP